jgi:hypothetical protein
LPSKSKKKKDIIFFDKNGPASLILTAYNLISTIEINGIIIADGLIGGLN